MIILRLKNKQPNSSLRTKGLLPWYHLNSPATAGALIPGPNYPGCAVTGLPVLFYFPRGISSANRPGDFGLD
jgi:hypothetical protein